MSLGIRTTFGEPTPEDMDASWVATPMSGSTANWFDLSPRLPWSEAPQPVPFGPYLRTHNLLTFTSPIDDEFFDTVIPRIVEAGQNPPIDKCMHGGRVFMSFLTNADAVAWRDALREMGDAPDAAIVEDTGESAPRVLPSVFVRHEMFQDRAMAQLAPHLLVMCSLEETPARLTSASRFRTPERLPPTLIPSEVRSIVYVDSLFSSTTNLPDLPSMRRHWFGDIDPAFFIYTALRVPPPPTPEEALRRQIVCSCVQDEEVLRWTRRVLRAVAPDKRRAAYTGLLRARCAFLAPLDWDTRDMRLISTVAAGRTLHSRRLAELMPATDRGGDRSPFLSDAQTRAFEWHLQASKAAATSVHATATGAISINFAPVAEADPHERCYYLRSGDRVHRIGYDFSLLPQTGDGGNLVPNFLRVLTVDRGVDLERMDPGLLGLSTREQAEKTHFIDMRAARDDRVAWLVEVCSQLEATLRKRQEELLVAGFVPDSATGVVETRVALFQQAAQCVRNMEEDLARWAGAAALLATLPAGFSLNGRELESRSVAQEACSTGRRKLNEGLAVLYSTLGQLRIYPPAEFDANVVKLTSRPIELLRHLLLWVQGQLREGLCDASVLQLQYVTTSNVILVVYESTRHFAEIAVEAWATVYHKFFAWTPVVVAETWRELLRGTVVHLTRACSDAYQKFALSKPGLERDAAALSSMKSFRALDHEGPMLDHARSGIKRRVQNMISIAEILESDPSLNGEIPSVENVLANGDAAAWIADYCAARGAARGPAAAPVAWDWRLEDNDAISERIIVACSYVDLVASSKSIMSFWRAATPATVLQHSFVISGSTHVVRDANEAGYGGLLISPSLETVDERHSNVWVVGDLVLSSPTAAYPVLRNEWVQTQLASVEQGLDSWPHRPADASSEFIVMPATTGARTTIVGFHVPWTYRTHLEEHPKELTWDGWLSNSAEFAFNAHGAAAPQRSDALVLFSFRLGDATDRSVLPRIGEALLDLAIKAARVQRENGVISLTEVGSNGAVKFVGEMLELIGAIGLGDSASGGQVRCIEVV